MSVALRHVFETPAGVCEGGATSWVQPGCHSRSPGPRETNSPPPTRARLRRTRSPDVRAIVSGSPAPPARLSEQRFEFLTFWQTSLEDPSALRRGSGVSSAKGEVINRTTPRVCAPRFLKIQFPGTGKLKRSGPTPCRLWTTPLFSGNRSRQFWEFTRFLVLTKPFPAGSYRQRGSVTVAFLPRLLFEFSVQRLIQEVLRSACLAAAASESPPTYSVARALRSRRLVPRLWSLHFLRSVVCLR